MLTPPPRWNYAIELVVISGLLDVLGFANTSSQYRPLGHINVSGISIECRTGPLVTSVLYEEYR